MEAIRQIVDGRLLSDIIALPRHYQNKKVEIIVIPMEEESGKLSFTRDEIDEMRKGSITEKLIGALPDIGKSLEDYRAERLSKYEHID
jgi:hypothetical protein